METVFPVPAEFHYNPYRNLQHFPNTDLILDTHNHVLNGLRLRPEGGVFAYNQSNVDFIGNRGRYRLSG